MTGVLSRIFEVRLYHPSRSPFCAVGFIGTCVRRATQLLITMYMFGTEVTDRIVLQPEGFWGHSLRVKADFSEAYCTAPFELQHALT